MVRIVKHSVTLRGHRTSISLEAPFWDHLKAFAARDGSSLNELIATVDEARVRRAPETMPGLSSALRVYVLERLERADGP
ncbi:MAG: ribbon-helix-helix domain-containing protein [Pseudomonadota bacterium]